MTPAAQVSTGISDAIAKKLRSEFGLIAPDTSGMNFYRADPVLADLLRSGSSVPPH